MDEIFFYAMSIAHSATSYTTTLKSHLLTPLKQYATTPPDLMSIALLLVIVYLSLSILGMASRWIYSVVITTVRLLLIVTLFGGAIWVWQRGPQKSQSDFYKVVEMVGEGVKATTKGAGAGVGTGAGGGFERPRYEY